MRRTSLFAGFFAATLFCILLVAWYRASEARGGMSLPEGVSLLVLRPAQRTLLGVGSWFADVGRTMFRRQGIISENANLQRQVLHLQGENQRLLRYRRENEELRRLLKMRKPPGGRFLAADIISLDATEFARRVVLNVGSRQGVRTKDVVFTAQGVVGQVLKADLFSCVVLLLIDREAGIGAMTARTMAKGVVRGTGSRVCRMSYLEFQADVREGDIVVTSGHSAIFPKGMVIGRVLKVEKNRTYSQMSADVDPAVPFDQISAVYVRVQAG